MGIIDKFFRNAKTHADYTLLNDKVYNIRKDPNDPHKIEIWLNGQKNKAIIDSEVVMQNDQLMSTWPYKYFFKDNFQEMAECFIHESAGVWYIRCNTWTPGSMGQFPDRIIMAGPVHSWFSPNEQVFIRESYESKVEILTSSGEYKSVDWLDIKWKDKLPHSKYVWYLATIDQAAESNYTITVISEVMSDVDVIVNGKMIWNMDTLKWEIKE